MITREHLLQSLVSALQGLDYVYACWEGGSTAFGRDDEYSDIDLMADAEPGRAADVFAAAEQAMEALSPVRLMYEIPQPAWHGHYQRFYLLENASPFHMVDLVVLDHLKPPRFMEVEQHGRARVHFDRAEVVHEDHLDLAAHRELLEKRLAQLRVIFPLFVPLVRKEVLRERPIDALSTYQSITLRFLTELLRIRHDPCRHSFGMRYLHFDLPAERAAKLTRLTYPASLSELDAMQAEAEQWFAEVLAEIDERGIELP